MFSLKRQAQKEPEGESPEKGRKKVVPGEIRIQKDISELDLNGTCSISFPKEDNILQFTITITPQEGYYKGGSFEFLFIIPSGYPHDAPKVKCNLSIYHPNIDIDGAVCLNILREDWKPILTINSIIYGLQYLFLEPNPEDPLNKDAAKVLKENKRLFEQNVARAMRGGYVSGHYFERCLI